MAEASVIGVDLGGTQVRAALVQGGRVLARAEEPTDVPGGPEAVLRQIRRLLKRVGAGQDRVLALGVCAPGPLDTETGTILRIPTMPGFDGLPLRDILAQETGLTVTLENDGIAAAQGEWRHGAGRGLRHMVYVTVSTGIGGGAIVDRRLLHGRRGMAGHIGHLPLDCGGPACFCGAPGCFEALASGSALAHAAREAVAGWPGSLLADRPSHELTARDVVDAARAGDALALSLLRDEARWLGLGFTALLHLYSPEAIVMGGGVSAAFDLLAPGIHAAIRDRALPAFRDVPVRPAGLSGDSGLIGAASLALESTSPSLSVGDRP